MKKLLLGTLLLSTAPAFSQVIISEFMASNSRTAADEDGAYEDWIELHNPSGAAVNLEGWSLTDNAAAPAKWVFPAVTIPARGYLMVWASNKNRRTPGSPLHTSFKLSDTGEYLALLKPDATVATAFAPAYPPQKPDLSYGPAAQATVTTALQPGSTGKVMVPADGALGTAWTAAAFDDSSWTTATNGIGFETGANEFGTGWLGDILADDPAGFYRLEESGVLGIPAPNSIPGGPPGIYLNGTAQDQPSLQSPAFPGFETGNTGAKFDGTNDKVDVPYSAAHNGTSFAFSFWMRWNGTIAGTHKCPLASRESSPVRGYIAYVLPTTQQLSFWSGTGAAWDTLDAPVATGTIAANKWYHVAGTYDGPSRLKTLYINGTQVAQKTAAAFVPNAQFPLRIGSGASEGAGQFWFPGDIDEVAVFNRPLTATEVKAQYDSATGAAGTGTEAAATLAAQTPAGWWRLGDPVVPVVPISAVNQGSAGAGASGTYYGAGVLGAAGPLPPSESGLPADNKTFRMSGGGYIETPYSPALNPPVFTVECWARATGGTGTFRAAVSGRNDTGTQTQGYIFYAASNNTWQFWTGSGGTGTWDPVTGPAVTLNQWVHLAGTYDGTTKRFYVNGTLAGTGTLSAFNPNTARGLRIGAGQNEAAANFLFQGDVDEVAIYPRALTAGEIAARYGLGKNNVQPPPVNDFAGLISTGLEPAMRNQNATAYFRLPFTVTDPAAIDGLLLKMKYDDGFQAYLNGVPVAGGNVPPVLTWNSAAAGRSSNAEAAAFESFNLNSALNALQPGTNVLSIHGLNLDAANPDFLQLAQLELTDVGAYSGTPLYLTTATPGSVNTSGTATPGPSVFAETLTPALPSETTDLVITCRAEAVFAPVAAITLHWRTGYTALQEIAMTDDGTGHDAAAADGIYTAVIPRTGYGQGQMVRWFFTGADTAGNTSRWPVFPAGGPSAEYFGTMIAATGFTTTLPVWHWFTQNAAAAASRAGTQASVFYNGEFYDNVFVRLRGGATSGGSKKFDFNTGSHAFINDEVGRVEEANLNGSSLGGAETIIRPATAFELLKRAGLPSCANFPVMMRLNGALDTATGRGGVAYFVEQVDERYLRRHGFDANGALYKMDQRGNLEPVFTDSVDGVQKRTRLTENNNDLQELVNAVHSSSPDDWAYNASPVAPVFPAGFTAQRTAKLFDLVNMSNVVNYLAARVIIGDTDDTRKNFYLYRDSEGDREWRILPWDKDGTLGLALDAAPFVGHPFQADYAHRKTNSYHQWNYLYEACFNEPKIRDMMLRRLRTLADTLLGSAAGGPEALVDSLWAPIAGTVPALATYSGVTPASLKDFFNIRRNGPASTTTSSGLFTVYAAAGGIAPGVQLPASQPAGAALTIGTVEFLPASGNQLEEYVQITNPNSFDIDISGWFIKGGITHTFEPGTVIRANDALYLANNKNAFRARATAPHAGQSLFIQGGFNGTLSARGETFTVWDPMDAANPADDRLVTTGSYPPAPTPAQQSLRITELMYDPAAGGSYPAGDYEFIELMNTGAEPLNLQGAAFTDGITFSFGATVLPAGERILLVKNPAAFAERYGNSPAIAGTFAGALDNSGERLRLIDAAGEEVLDFSWEGTWFPNTHGDTLPAGGASLVIENPQAAWDSWGLQSSWRSSSAAAGSPGAADALPPAAVITSVADGVIQLSGEAGRTYLLQRSDGLGNWIDAGYSTPPAGAFTITPPASGTRAFYRVKTR